MRLEEELSHQAKATTRAALARPFYQAEPRLTDEVTAESLPRPDFQAEAKLTDEVTVESQPRPDFQAEAKHSHQAEALTIARTSPHAMTELPRQESMASTLAPSTYEEPMAAPIFSSYFAHLAASSSFVLTIFIPSLISLTTPAANSSLSPTVPPSFIHTLNASANILRAFAPSSSNFVTIFHYATTVQHAPPYMFHTEGAVLSFTTILFLLLYDIHLPVC